MLPIDWLGITATKSLSNYWIYRTTNHLHCVDASFDVFSIHNLLPLITALRILWTYWLPFWMVMYGPFGKAEPTNVLALLSLIRLKLIHLAKWFILLAKHLFINHYLHVTALYSAIGFPSLQISVKRCTVSGENISPHYVLCFPFPCIAPHI
jgi:hypothetical protein